VAFRDDLRPRGEDHHKAVLTWAKVRAIRTRYAQTRESVQGIADDYRVCRSTVRALLEGKTWKDPEYTPPDPPGANKGERAHTAVLTLDRAKEIRVRYAAGGTSMEKISHEYGVSVMTIHRVIWNKCWKDPQYTPPLNR
jgi:uncharacterized protein YjcR